MDLSEKYHLPLEFGIVIFVKMPSTYLKYNIIQDCTHKRSETEKNPPKPRYSNKFKPNFALSKNVMMAVKLTGTKFSAAVIANKNSLGFKS